MKYYIREMKGSFVTARLLAVPDQETPGGLESYDEEGWVVAHCSAVPDSPLTKLLMPDCKDFGDKWALGPDRTGDGHMMGGHHVGAVREITEGEAKEYLRQAQ